MYFWTSSNVSPLSGECPTARARARASEMSERSTLFAAPEARLTFSRELYLFLFCYSAKLIPEYARHVANYALSTAIWPSRERRRTLRVQSFERSNSFTKNNCDFQSTKGHSLYSIKNCSYFIFIFNYFHFSVCLLFFSFRLQVNRTVVLPSGNFTAKIVAEFHSRGTLSTFRLNFY